MTNYLLRLDDIAHNMNWENFENFIEIANQYHIKPVLAVIPDNKDSDLLSHPRKNDDYFWKLMSRLNLNGWEIGMHGLNHLFHTKDSGILGINDYSEFSGLDLKKQTEKIKESIQIFRNNSINPRLFIAPAHTFDCNTLKALIDNDIKLISDGYSLYPYYYKGITFIPQLFGKPRKIPFGFFTFCIHLNNIDDNDFLYLINFIKMNHKKFINLDSAIKLSSNSITNNLTKSIFKRILKLKRNNYKLKKNV